MAKQLELRYGTTSQLNSFKGGVGELTYDTQTKDVRIHDGVTDGGFPLAKKADLGIPSATETVAGKAKIATTSIAQAGINDSDFITAKKLRDALNATGDAPVSACRAWVNFNGTAGTILKGFNVASITRNSLGDYTVTLASAMPNTDYSLLFGGIEHPNGTPLLLSLRVDSSGVPLLKTTSSFRVSLKAQTSNTYFDAVNLSIGVFC